MLRLLRPPEVYVVALVLLEYVVFFLTVPARVARLLAARDIWLDWPAANMLGQTDGWLRFNAAALMVVFYIWKLSIVRDIKDRQAAVVRYALVTAVFVPYLWVLVSGDWSNPAASDLAIYLGCPVGMLLVPTLTFAADLRYADGYTSGDRWLRSAVELLALVPLWNLVWWYMEWSLPFLYWAPRL